MKDLLAEGVSTTEIDNNGWSVLLYAATDAQYTTMWWLLLEAEGIIGELTNDATLTVWSEFNIKGSGYDELSAMLKIMVMLEDAPANFFSNLHSSNFNYRTPGFAPGVSSSGPSCRLTWPGATKAGNKGQRFVAHCPLLVMKQSIVITYAATIAAPEDMWADGLRV
jgi:hypothetical protein